MDRSMQAGDQLLLKYGLENLPFGVNGLSYFAAAKKFATTVEVICAPDRDAAADKIVTAAKAAVKTAGTNFCSVFRKTHRAQGARSLNILLRIATLKQARVEFIKAKNLLQETLKNPTDLKAITTVRNKVKQAAIKLVLLLRACSSPLSHARAELIEARSNLETTKELKKNPQATVEAAAAVRLAEVNFVALLRSRSSPLSHARAELIETRSNLEATKELKKNPQAAFMNRLTELCTLLSPLSEKVEDTAAIPAIVGYAKTFTFVMPFGLALAIPFVAAPALGIAAMSCFFTRNFIYAANAALSVSYGKERSSSHNKIWDGVRLFSATQLLLGTTLDLLHTLGGLGPAAFGSLSGYTFAAYMYLCAAQEGHYTYRAWRKSWDMDYFIAERKEAIVAEIKLLVDRRTWLDHLLAKDPIASANEHLKKSCEKIEFLEKQVEALVFYKKEEANRKELENTKTSYHEPMDADSKQNRAIAHILISKEKKKKENHRMKFFTFLAVGTVIATAVAIILPSQVILAIMIFGIIAALIKGAQSVNSDYSEKAMQAVMAKRLEENYNLNAEDIKEKLLTKAIRDTLTEKFQKTDELYEENAIAAIKAALSEKHKKQLINVQARKEYDPGTYLRTKIKSTNNGISKIGSAFCSFFAINQEELDFVPSQIKVLPATITRRVSPERNYPAKA